MSIFLSLIYNTNTIDLSCINNSMRVALATRYYFDLYRRQKSLHFSLIRGYLGMFFNLSRGDREDLN